jgi:hypothetical protein
VEFPNKLNGHCKTNHKSCKCLDNGHATKKSIISALQPNNVIGLWGFLY